MVSPPAALVFPLQAIGIIHSCFKQKFGIPRQPRLVPEAEASLELLPPFDRPEAIRGLEGFSHLWVLFVLHQCPPGQWSPTVRPPRLGGNRKVGVFASRSPFRPNPIGLSAVELAGIEQTPGRIQLQLRGVDLLDGSPVLDIKPYVPYADSIGDARGGFADGSSKTKMPVTFDLQPKDYLDRLPRPQARKLRRLIVHLIEQDPRPAYRERSGEPQEFGMALYDLNICWETTGHARRVTAIEATLPPAARRANRHD